MSGFNKTHTVIAPGVMVDRNGVVSVGGVLMTPTFINMIAEASTEMRKKYILRKFNQGHKMVWIEDPDGMTRSCVTTDPESLAKDEDA